MEFLNTTTGKKIDLTIIDRKSGIEWTKDLLGNSESLNYNIDTDQYELDQEDIEWWSNIIEGLEEIENLKEQAKELVPYEEFEDLEIILNNEGDACDLERNNIVQSSILYNFIEEHK